jgi:hypothetical protein
MMSKTTASMRFSLMARRAASALSTAVARRPF